MRDWRRMKHQIKTSLIVKCHFRNGGYKLDEGPTEQAHYLRQDCTLQYHSPRLPAPLIFFQARERSDKRDVGRAWFVQCAWSPTRFQVQVLQSHLRNRRRNFLPYLSVKNIPWFRAACRGVERNSKNRAHGLPSTRQYDIRTCIF